MTMTMTIKSIFFSLLILCMPLAPVHAQSYNYEGRKPIIINNSPHVKLSAFSFGNAYADRRNRFEQRMNWENTASQPLVAFEIVVLKYDAFDQRLTGSRWTVNGRNSADWQPLKPGDMSSDGTIGYGSEEVLTAIAYVRAVRLADGTVWRANEAEVSAELRKVAPGIKDVGSLKPDQKPKSE